MNSFYPSHIEYSSSVLLEDEIDTYFTRITGKIICGDLNIEQECEVGKIEAFYLDLVGAWSDGYPTEAVFDLDQETYDHFSRLFDPVTEEVQKDVLDSFGPDILGDNWLVLNRLEILPRFRGKKLGLAAMHRTIQQYAKNCAFVALEVAPLQLGERTTNSEKQRAAEMQFHLFTQDKAIAAQRLKDHYSIVGFKEVPNSNIMLLNPTYQQPTLKEIGFKFGL